MRGHQTVDEKGHQSTSDAHRVLPLSAGQDAVTPEGNAGFLRGSALYGRRPKIFLNDRHCIHSSSHREDSNQSWLVWKMRDCKSQIEFS